ncbi:uncharacterized protein LOC126838328 [Adelges cooleyi]|uniref:uncharacterized protein LOC126838328 n=1 Tax=Adelges cooleyi TaxID=133065 RepID=UPI0021803749|nr:uncharacterized protein LOC126838328 [Adelges cooleyi]
MSNFDLEKMVSTVDNLSTCLDVMLCLKNPEGGKEILGTYEKLDSLVISFDDQISTLKNVLIKEKNARQTYFQKQVDELKMIVDRCEHMITNIPLNSFHTNEPEHLFNQNGTKDFKVNMNNMSMSPVASSWTDMYSPTETTIHQNTMSNNTMMSAIMGHSKFHTSKQILDTPLLKLVDNDEMNSVPKYMKGRLNSLNINTVIDSINKALENKYEILRKPKSSLKKKDLDAYNDWKIQQSTVGQGQYFVTAEDITKYSETKVDKTTLNIIPILRHLKRLKESRVGGFVFYLPY